MRQFNPFKPLRGANNSGPCPDAGSRAQLPDSFTGGIFKLAASARPPQPRGEPGTSLPASSLPRHGTRVPPRPDDGVRSPGGTTRPQAAGGARRAASTGTQGRASAPPPRPRPGGGSAQQPGRAPSAAARAERPARGQAGRPLAAKFLNWWPGAGGALTAASSALTAARAPLLSARAARPPLPT